MSCLCFPWALNWGLELGNGMELTGDFIGILTPLSGACGELRRSHMEEQVRELRRRNAEMEAICIDGGGAVEAADITDGHMKPWQPIGKASILGYNLRSDIERQYEEVCRKMLTPEIQYLTDLGVNLWVH